MSRRSLDDRFQAMPRLALMAEMGAQCRRAAYSRSCRAAIGPVSEFQLPGKMAPERTL